MSRTGQLLLLFFGVTLPGCYGIGPFSGPARVPPPPTGAVGTQRYDNGYNEPAPQPSAGLGAAAWPAQNWPHDGGLDALDRPQDAFGSAPSNTVPPLSVHDNGRRNSSDQNLSDQDASNQDSSQPAAWDDPLASSYAPGLRLTRGPTPPLVPTTTTPPRIRGFQQAGDQRELYVPEALAAFRNPALPASGQVRQAHVYSNWQPRYDDVRR